MELPILRLKPNQNRRLRGGHLQAGGGRLQVVERLADQVLGRGRALGTLNKRGILPDEVEELFLIVVDLGPSIDSSCLRTFSDSSSKRLVPNQRSR